MARIISLPSLPTTQPTIESSDCKLGPTPPLTNGAVASHAGNFVASPLVCAAIVHIFLFHINHYNAAAATVFTPASGGTLPWCPRQFERLGV
jgi:hypothetical protein